MLDLLNGILARFRSYARGLRRGARVEAEMQDEFRLHLDLRTQDLVRSGLSADEAARRARVEFGHIDTHRERALAARGLGILDQMRFSRLDLKLGLRMLIKHPALSLVSVTGMAVAIAIAAIAFAAVDALVGASVPLHESDRVIAIRQLDVRKGAGEPEPHSASDFQRWRRELRSVQDLTAYTSEMRNLVLPDGRTEVVGIARMTASGFRVARVAPALGRVLVDEDEAAGAEPVLVIGHAEWQRVWEGDPSVIGQQVRIGGVPHTIVGVMPEDFRFPVNQQYWTALQLGILAHGEGPPVTMFGRLAAGVATAEARSELTAMGRRAAASWPETHGHLRPQLVSYARGLSGIDSPAAAMQLHGIKVAVALLLLVVAVNVSVLVYARTATRLGEISVRTALGASRTRVITQLFAEALVLAAVAAGLGLAIAAVALDAYSGVVNPTTTPFWQQYRISPQLVLYVTALAIFASVVVGVLPALKVTGRRVQAGLQQLTARGSHVQLGPVWTLMIVLQVAAAVAALPYTLYVAGASLHRATSAERFPAEQIMRANLALEEAGGAEGAASDEPDNARLLAGAREFIRRLEGEPDVAGVSFTRSFPGYEWGAVAEVEGGATFKVQENQFAVDLLPLFDQPLVAGRGFTAADAGPGADAVIVNQAFANSVGLPAERLPGLRVRLATPAGATSEEATPNRWLHVVGVVPDFTHTEGLDPNPDPLLYRPLTLEAAVEGAGFVMVVVRLREGGGDAMAGRLRQLAAAIGPGLQVTSTITAAELRREAREATRFLGIGVAVFTLSVLFLSAAGIYAMTSVTVARRRREIGIRAALGAGARQVLAGVFARAGAQLGAGVLAGIVVALILNQLAGGVLSRHLPLLLPLVAAIMLLVGLLASLGPARRGLAVQPSEALRGD